jgi:hypothetical protein
MKTAPLALLIFLSAAAVSRADLTIVQSLHGAEPLHEVTVKIKGDKARIESGQQVTTIMDANSGDVITIMNDEKRYTRISGERMKAMTQMAAQFGAAQSPSEKAKLTPTGKKETINGYETQEYAVETPQIKATYWIASNYPDGAGILKQLQALTPRAFGMGANAIPDYRDLPGLPLRTKIAMGGRDIVTTITSVKQDPLADAQFAVPAGFQEVKLPAMPGLDGGKEATPPAKPSPKT